MLNQQPELLVRLGLGMKVTMDEDNERLFAAIPLRHTNRSAYDDRVVPEEMLTQLQHDAGQEGTWLHIVQDEPTRQAITQLIVAGDREQWADKRFRHELAEWVRPGGTESSDGLPGSAQAKGSIHQKQDQPDL